uniref:Uncharacterized protein n=1 Tax=Anguilla anguilla TaxID=7936 RepID=A0A0E9Q6E5_ANGAN
MKFDYMFWTDSTISKKSSIVCPVFIKAVHHLGTKIVYESLLTLMKSEVHKSELNSTLQVKKKNYVHFVAK